MTPLALSGTAKSVSGATVHGRHLLRLRDANSGPVCEADAAIIRDDTDLYIARERRFGTAFVFDARSDSDFAGLDTLMSADAYCLRRCIARASFGSCEKPCNTHLLMF